MSAKKYLERAREHDHQLRLVGRKPRGIEQNQRALINHVDKLERQLEECRMEQARTKRTVARLWKSRRMWQRSVR